MISDYFISKLYLLTYSDYSSFYYKISSLAVVSLEPIDSSSIITYLHLSKYNDKSSVSLF